MNKDTYTATFRVPEVPDPECTAYRAAAGGNVAGAIGRAFAHFLGNVTYTLPDTCAAELLYSLNPQGDGRDRQTRLTLYLRLWASDRGTACNLDRLVRGGPLSQYYEFLSVEAAPGTNGLTARCRIVRPVSFIAPLYSCEFNPGIPDYYYTLRLFVPNRENNGMMLDRVLDCIDEPAAITIRVQSTDIAESRQAHAHYLARLENINSRWNGDEEDPELFDYAGTDGGRSLGWHNALRALSLKDQLAYDVLRSQREIHRSLFQPHLSFDIVAAAQSAPVARLLASVVGGSAFEEGSYEVESEGDGISSGGGNEGLRPTEDPLSAPCQGTPGEAQWSEYESLRPLSRSASVEELAGVFRLPIASSCSPCCIRRNTDPPPVRPEDLVVLGYDMESGADRSAASLAQPRGPSFDQLNKHAFVSGMPGSGKTTAIMCMLIQLHGGSMCRRGTQES